MTRYVILRRLDAPLGDNLVESSFVVVATDVQAHDSKSAIRSGLELQASGDPDFEAGMDHVAVPFASFKVEPTDVETKRLFKVG